jgi:hypothetical protein
MYVTITANNIRSAEQSSIIFFIYDITNNYYYLNNVKSFYLSILASHSFRKTFSKGLINLLPHYGRQRIQALMRENLVRPMQMTAVRGTQIRNY